MEPAAFDSEPVAVAPEARGPLAAGLRRLRHDLGKSMSLQLRFAGEDADDETLAEALREDVLRTRRGPAGTRSAFELFDEAEPWLGGRADLPGGAGPRADLSADAALRALVDAIGELRSHREAIAAGTLRGPALARLVERARAGTAACRALVLRYPGGAGG